MCKKSMCAFNLLYGYYVASGLQAFFSVVFLPSDTSTLSRKFAFFDFDLCPFLDVRVGFRHVIRTIGIPVF